MAISRTSQLFVFGCFWFRKLRSSFFTLHFLLFFFCEAVTINIFLYFFLNFIADINYLPVY